MASEPKFQRIMAAAVIDCLKSNMDNSLPQVLFERLCSSRADLAFTLLQRLVDEQSTVVEVKDIITIAWATLRACNTNVEAALSSTDADYYRMLLKILYLSIQFHTSVFSTAAAASDNRPNSDAPLSSPPHSRTTIQTVLEILSSLIAQGFRSLTVLLHTSPIRVHPSDFSTLTAILRSCLQVPKVDQNSVQLLVAFSESQTARCAATLLSWSDQLASSTFGDPVFGELSISFLLELSSNPTLAEALAVDGVLGQVLSTSIVGLLQSRAFTPRDPSPRMYTIWARGLLPLLLNLLNAIGAPIAGEVAAAVNRFPEQLANSSDAFANNARTNNGAEGYVTLSMVQEAHDLALIVNVLGAIRDAGASAAICAGDVDEVTWDSAQLKEDAETCLQERRRLRGRIIAMNQKEEAWLQMKPLREGQGSENLMEEKVVDGLRQLVGILSGNIET